jgi:hypothetical protein
MVSSFSRKIGVVVETTPRVLVLASQKRRH